ncbi:2-hydroxyacid dehydrogenase [Mangrovicoccus algicola]|uniref:Glyoxylate/hydroxypyruvate reductase A n=1 Tax=Mangrovicoccus algicola TaxID=2771008 RepID=A0A8J7CGX9_9RHOB|nr:glyoxylate/hydroxypyruvate reductase A [Mangrovicoccus algicola]MBE3637635.1 glyoxylate/hydroxypyruvate reductase A [Mangrovicoccus algicola]
MKLLVKSGGEDVFGIWKDHFADLAPGLETHFWSDPAVAPEEVDAVMAWEPSAGWLASLPNLRLVISSGAGVDHITRDPDWPRHLPLVRMGGMEQRMSEYVAWAALSLLRGTRDFALGQAAREWRYKEVPFSAADRTVGVMGLGNLGLAAARTLQGLGFDVRGWARSAKQIDGLKTFAGRKELGAFLGGTDILLDLLPATAATENMLDAAFLAQLPEGAQFINAGRGKHLVEADLLAALDSGAMAGAVLDVFQTEPLPADSPLWSHPAVTVTPHIASTPGKREKAAYVADVLRRFAEGAPLPNVYDPEKGY